MTPDDRRMDDRTRRAMDEATASYRRALDALPPGAPAAAALYEGHLARVREIFDAPAAGSAPQPLSAAPAASQGRGPAPGSAAGHSARAARPWPSDPPDRAGAPSHNPAPAPGS